MPTYVFKHPETKEIFEEIRPMSDSDRPFYAPDGILCQKVISGFVVIDKNQEVFEMDESYTKLTNPKYVRFKDGHKEKYNPSKHYGGAGKGFDDNKLETEISLPKQGRPGQKIFKSGNWYRWNDDKKSWEKE